VTSGKVIAEERATPTFQDACAGVFTAHFERLFRYLQRLSGDPDLAADLAQEAFVRLHARGAMPDETTAWLITVATNLFRNAQTMRSRRRRLLTEARAVAVLADPAPAPGQGADMGSADRVRAAIDRMSERDRQLLLLRAEGCSYREIASALQLNEASIGTLLARAKRAFREAYDE
jgi:RNA polymerase sigma-70 factor (ECF subfamily)